MQVDRCARVMPIFQRVHKLFGDLLPKSNIVTASSPNPPYTAWDKIAHDIISLQEYKPI